MQRKNICELVFTCVMAVGMMSVYAEKIQCPPVEMIKNVTFYRAAYDDQWNFWSEPFYYQNQEWNIWFITDLPDKYPLNPLLDANKAYSKATIANLHPKAEKVRFYPYYRCIYSSLKKDGVGIDAYNPKFTHF